MNTRNIQTFLMASAAFFAMSAPVRSASTSTPSNSIACTARVSSQRLPVERVTPSSQTGEEDQNT
jgi:hypothetical protein